MGLLYARATDELGHLATVTLTTGTADVNYPVTNVQGRDPSLVFLTSDTAGADLVFDHGSAVDVQGFSLHHHNVPPASNVRVQRNASNSWGGPSMDVALPLVTPPNVGLPMPVALDLRLAAGYNGATGYRYSRLHIPSAGQLTGLGSVNWWAMLRADVLHVRYPVRDALQLPTTFFRTKAGVRRGYRFPVRLRWMPVAFRQRDTGWLAFKALFDACEGSYFPFLWWPDESTTDGWLAAFHSDTLERERPINTVHDVVVRIEELGCGLSIPTAP